MGRTVKGLAALVLGISAAFPGAPVAAADAPKPASAARSNVVFDDESAAAQKGVRIDLAGACAPHRRDRLRVSEQTLHTHHRRSGGGLLQGDVDYFGRHHSGLRGTS